MSTQTVQREVPTLPISLTRRLTAEFVGTAAIVIFAAGAAVVSASRGHSLILEGVAACNGLTVLVLIYALGHISGAHFNPGVTLSFAAFRHFQVRDVVPYWLAQLTGAVAGALILHALFGHFADVAVTSPSGSNLQSFGYEFILTFLLMLVIISVATDTRAVGQAAAIAIGAAVGLDVALGGSISGGSMNPARSFGPAIASWDLSSLWIYLIAPPLGALAGAAFYTFVREGHS